MRRRLHGLISEVLPNEEEEPEEPKYSPIGENCVVTLIEEKRIVKGLSDFSVKFYGYTFLFETREKMEKFSSDPRLYLQEVYHTYHQRVLIIGDSVSGKKTMVDRLSKYFEIEVVEFDKLVQGNYTIREITTNNIISGLAWLDENQDGKKETNEKLLSGIKVILFDVSTNTIAKDNDGNNAETMTNSDGEYSFTKIKSGDYIVLFEYDTTQYELTTYMAEGVLSSQNSKVIQKTVNVNGEEKVYAVTDTINLTDDISNINMGLKEMSIYDFELASKGIRTFPIGPPRLKNQSYHQ